MCVPLSRKDRAKSHWSNSGQEWSLKLLEWIYMGLLQASDTLLIVIWDNGACNRLKRLLSQGKHWWGVWSFESHITTLVVETLTAQEWVWMWGKELKLWLRRGSFFRKPFYSSRHVVLVSSKEVGIASCPASITPCCSGWAFCGADTVSIHPVHSLTGAYSLPWIVFKCSSSLIPLASLWSRHHFYPHCTKGETEAERGKAFFMSFYYYESF